MNIEDTITKLNQIVERAKKEIEKCEKRLTEIIGRGEDHDGDAHVEADEALCELLKALDCKSVVHLFEKVDKWYS